MAASASRRRSPAEIAISIGVLALGIIVFFAGRALAGGQNYSLIGPEMMPMIVGIGLTVLGAWLLHDALTADGWRNAEPDEAAERSEHPFLPGAFFWVLGGMVAQMLLMDIGGFVIASGAVFTCVARGFGSRRWLRDLIIGLAIGLAVFLFFVRFLNVNLPAGVLLPILGTAGL
ncbi:MAG: tripartite tricarboxylate transporter TctB family protein [Lautropia sp.]